MLDFKSLLPSNATPLQRAIEKIAAERLAAIATPVADIWDAHKCPTNLLGYLAWALSVDYWDERWPEPQKRAVVAASYDVHRMKGTIGAVRAALGALDIGLELREWYETGGASGTFAVDAFADTIFAAGLGIDPALVTMIRRQIDPVKRGSQHYSIRVGEKFTAQIYMRSGTRQRVRDTRDHELTPAAMMSTGALFMRSAVREAFRHRMTHDVLRAA